MIKQDYLIRMIQEIITLIVQALLLRRRIPQKQWVEYDCLTRQILGVPTDELLHGVPDELMERYRSDPQGMGKIELAAVTMLKMADEQELSVVQKSKLEQDALSMLRYVQHHSGEFSLLRTQIIEQISNRYQ